VLAGPESCALLSRKTLSRKDAWNTRRRIRDAAGEKFTVIESWSLLESDCQCILLPAATRCKQDKSHIPASKRRANQGGRIPCHLNIVM